MAIFSVGFLTTMIPFTFMSFAVVAGLKLHTPPDAMQQPDVLPQPDDLLRASAADQGLLNQCLSWDGGVPSFGDAHPQYRDVAYKQIKGNDLKLDIYLPKSALRAEMKPKEGIKDIPVLLYAHPDPCKALLKKHVHEGVAFGILDEGFALVSIDYRKINEFDKWGGAPVTWPAQGEDVKDAVRWLKKTGPQYGLDVNRIACWGESSGSQLCNYLATAGALHKDTQIQAAVSVFGSTCYLCDGFTDNIGEWPSDWYFNFPVGRISALKNGTAALDKSDKSQREVAKDIELVESAEALHLVTVSKGKTSPIFISHGVDDTLVPIEKARLFDKVLTKYGVRHDMVSNEGNHMYDSWSAEDVLRMQIRAFDFIKTQLAAHHDVERFGEVTVHHASKAVELSGSKAVVGVMGSNGCASYLTPETCKSLASDNELPFKRGTWSDYPKGCFWNHNGNIYYNTHLSGAPNSDPGARPICKQASK